jgi:hypothetical protein
MTTLKKIEPEADGILKDGQMIQFRPMQMDADSLAGEPVVSDHHRPRALPMTDVQRKAAMERQAAYDKRISDAWRNPPAQHVPQDLSKTPPEVTKPVAFGEPNRAASDSVALDAIQATNQQRYNARLENAWRNPINQGVR